MMSDLSLEKLKISERLSSLETSIAGHTQKVESFVEGNSKEHEEIKEMLTRYDHAIFGNGKEGLIVTNDRNTRTIGTITWVVGVLVVAIIGLVIDLVKEMLRGH